MAAEERAPKLPFNRLSEDLGNSAPWYRSHIGRRLRPSTRILFEGYSALSGSKLENHLHAIREKAWHVRKYPCLGQWGFLESGLFHSREYATILERLKCGQSFLDIGCCLAQDLRRLAFDGAPTQEMYATDLTSDFWEIGYDLFRDRSSMKAHFMKADILEANSALASLDGKIDVVYAGSVLHLFGWKKQIEICKRIVRLSRAGTTFLGCQVGRLVGEEVGSRWGGGSTMFNHDVESFKEMWQDVCKETRTCWNVEAELGELQILGLENEDFAWMRPGSMLLQFAVTRQPDADVMETVSSALEPARAN